MKIIATNKYVRSDYEVLRTYEAGISLFGWEVKSLRAGHINLKGSYCTFKNKELFLTNSHINLYMAVEGDELRARKLLLHKEQLKRILINVESQSLTIVPLKIYFTNKSKIKLEIAVVKGLNKHDKRNVIKQREAEKNLLKSIKNYL